MESALASRGDAVVERESEAAGALGTRDRGDAEAAKKAKSEMADTVKSSKGDGVKNGGQSGAAKEEEKEGVECMELNDNPRLGKGGAQGMHVVVQLALLVAPEGLRRLHLDGCALVDDSMVALAKHLKEEVGRRLEELWLSRNLIGDPGAERLAEALESGLPRIREIYLFANNIGQHGKRRLRSAFSAKVHFRPCISSRSPPARFSSY
eukprot:1232996-Rhodomonas_salina.1